MNNNKKWWNDDTNELIRLYVTTDNITAKNRIYTELLPVFKRIIYILLNKYKLMNLEYTEDYIQDCLLKVLTVLDKITEDKVITSQQYIYNSVHNYIVTYILNKINADIIVYTNISGSECLNDYDYDTYVEDNTDMIDTRIDIINKIDIKIKEEKVINKSNTVFLLGLKEYILKNNFDVREFDQYIMQKMNIKYTTYQIIASRLNIRTKILNEKFIK